MNIGQERLFIGVDGGGTKTAACLARCSANLSKPTRQGSDHRELAGQLEIVSTGRSGPSNMNRLEWEVACANVASAIDQALSSIPAEYAAASIDGVCLAMSGAGTNDGQERWREWAAKRSWANAITVVGDGEPLFEYCCPNRDAVVLIAGTGSLVLTRTCDGIQNRSGGWGPRIGDVGSGVWIGYEALRRVAAEMDSKKVEGEFSRLVMAQLEVETHSDFRQSLRSVDLDVTAATIARHVVEWSIEGVPSAREIVNRAMWKLASLVQVACHRDGLDDYELIMTGGVLTEQESNVDELLRVLGESEMAPDKWQLVKNTEEAAAAVALRAFLSM